MSITLTNAFDALTRVKKNIGNVTLESKLEWANTVNDTIYNEILKIYPEKYITDFTLNIESGTAAYTAPTDIKVMDIFKTGIFKTQDGDTYGLLSYDAQSGAFTVGDTVTGASSSATGVISEDHDAGTTGYLILTSVTGTFEDNEAITDTTTGAAVTNGTLTAYDHWEQPLSVTNFGSTRLGWWYDGTNYNITPEPEDDDVYVNRYIPQLSDFTALTESFVNIPNAGGKYLKLIKALLLVEYAIFDKDAAEEQIADQRAQILMKEFFSEINIQPQTFQMNINNLNY